MGLNLKNSIMYHNVVTWQKIIFFYFENTYRNATTKDAIVIIINWSVVSVTPHGTSPRWVDHHTMADYPVKVEQTDGHEHSWNEIGPHNDADSWMDRWMEVHGLLFKSPSYLRVLIERPLKKKNLEMTFTSII